jgi:DNA-binding transcriptional regulator YiaG
MLSVGAGLSSPDRKHNRKDPYVAKADEIRTMRKRLGISQQAMSNLTGIPRRTIANWELGINEPSSWVMRLVVEDLERLKEVLDVDEE